MLLLVRSHRHKIRLIKQYIRRHKHRVRKKTYVDIIGVLLALILKLSHTRHLAELSITGKKPRKRGMLRNVRLYKKGAFFGIDTDCQKYCVSRIYLTAKLGRLLPYGYCMKIGNSVKAIIFLLQQGPVFKRTQIISKG